jgi:hypothetical protein
MESELERYEKAFRALASSLAHNVANDFNLRCVDRDIHTHPVLSGLDLKSLVSFLEEYTELRQAVDAGAARLRDLGV